MGCNVSYSDSRSQSGNRSQSKRKGKMDISLPNGDKMPAVGYGTWKAAGDDLEVGIEAALEAGYRHIDTAAAYQNEEIIGKVLKRWFDEGKLKRKDLFITTKLPPYGIHPSEVEKCLNKSLADLQLDYVDLYLVHVPFGLAKGEDLFPTDENGYIIFDPDTDHIAVWKEMEAQVDAGKTRSIGISNFNIRQMKKLLVNARIPPANLQVELHVFLQQQELTNFCKENEITVTAYSPLGSGAWKNTAENGQPESINTCPEVKELADRHNKTQAQVLLRFLVQEGYSVIPKSVNPKRIQENIDIFDFELDEDEMDRLKTLDQGENGRVITFDFFKGIRDHPEFPF